MSISDSVLAQRLVPSGGGDLAFQKRLQESERWPAERLLAHQFAELRRLSAHAARSVPFYRERFAAAEIDPAYPFDADDWRHLPVLTRRNLQQAGEALRSNAVPAEHGDIITTESSGSTGMPVTVHGTVFDAVVAKAMTLRFHLWHPPDFTGKYALIKRFKKGEADYPAGASHPRWDDTATLPFATGPAASLSIAASIAEQAEWLQRIDPDYLLTYPSNLLFLARHCRAHGIALPHLEHVVSMAEVLNLEVREECRLAFDAPVIDAYSAQEVCNIAFQCPDHPHLHVLAETIVVEVIDKEGRPCAPGETGRVVVTPLHNYATPLLRYELGDWAEVGGACSCGRTLPVLTRILGRERNNLLLTATGERYWPAFGTRRFTEIAPILQHQFVQKAADRIEARFVVARALTPEEERQLRAHILAQLPAPFRLNFVYRDDIPRNAGGKFENFISEMPR